MSRFNRVMVPANAETAALMERAEQQRVSDLKIARASDRWQPAVDFLRGFLPPEVRSQIHDLVQMQSEAWPARYHMDWGMHVRNSLRNTAFGEKDFGVLNLDNIYVELVEEAVQS